MIARTSVAAVVYVLIAIVMTWPVARFLDSRIAADLGDPLFNCWVIAWVTGQLLSALQGEWSAIGNIWNANIFYPEPLTLAYSEHLFGQALQALPLQATGGNILLSYNVIFISTFALSGLAVYVLVRDLTEQPLAAFLAGLAFAYAPYRMGQLSHLQVLSSYWMPFALVGLRRYFVRVQGRDVRGALRALAAGAVATAMQNLSNGYYMLFFAPFLGAYCGYELVQRRLVTSWRVWGHLAAAAAFVGLVTWPFASAYLELRSVSDLGQRSIRDLVQFSADTHSFATAPHATLPGSWLRGFPKAEGTGFPGFTILLFAGVGVAWGVRRLSADLRLGALPYWHVVLLGVSVLTFVASFGIVLWFFVNGTLAVQVSSRLIVYQDASTALAFAGGSFIGAVLLVSLARRGRTRPSELAFGFFALGAVAAALLALGPEISARGRGIGTGPYLWLYQFVPGYDGLRVPARFLMLVTLFMAVLAGLGAARVLTWRRRRVAAGLVVLGMAGIVAEGNALPIAMNAGGAPQLGLAKPHPPVVGGEVLPIYEHIRTSAEPVVLLELPFGDRAYEMLAVFYAGHHRRPIVNGYSGMFPRSHRRNASALRDVTSNPDRARRALERAGATHVLVHEGAWRTAEGQKISAWLASLGARPVLSHGSDRLFALR